MLYVVYFSKAVTKKQKNKKQCSNVAIKEKNIQLSVAMVCFLYFWCCQINKQILTLVRRDFVLKDYCNGGRRTIVMGFLDGSDGKESAAMQETWVQSMEWEDFLEKGMETHSSILAWRIPWTEEPDGLQSMGSQRVERDWAANIIAIGRTCPLRRALSISKSGRKCFYREEYMWLERMSRWHGGTVDQEMSFLWSAGSQEEQWRGGCSVF